MLYDSKAAHSLPGCCLFCAVWLAAMWFLGLLLLCMVSAVHGVVCMHVVAISAHFEVLWTGAGCVEAGIFLSGKWLAFD